MSKRIDINNYYGGWLNFGEAINAAARKSSGANTYAFDAIEAARDVMEARVKQRGASRDKIVQLYLKSMSTYYVIKQGGNANLSETEQELAAAKAEHLKLYGEEIVLSFRQVGGDHGAA